MSLIDRLRSAAQQVAQTAQRLAEQRQSATPAQPAQQPAQKLSTFSTRQLDALQGGSGFDAPANRYTTLASPFAPTAPVADEVTAPDPAEVETAYAGIRDQPVALRAHAFIETLRQHEGDPAFQAALIEHGLRNDGDEVLHQTVIDVFGNEGGRYFNSTFDEADRGLLAGAFTAARESGVLTDNDFRTRAARLSGWEDIAQRLGVEQVGLNPANDAAVAEVREAQTALLDARNRAEALDERMYRELASFGPALTDAQREAYIRAYRDDPTHVETYRAVAERAEALETLLVENSAAMEDAAIRDPHFAQDLFAAHQALAQTGRAGASVARVDWGAVPVSSAAPASPGAPDDTIRATDGPAVAPAITTGPRRRPRRHCARGGRPDRPSRAARAVRRPSIPGRGSCRPAARAPWSRGWPASAGRAPRR